MSTKTKQYYWLKLAINFFQDPKLKKLRRIAGGDTYIIIYLKMMLLSVPMDGIILFEGIEETFVEELALILDEEEGNSDVVEEYSNWLDQKKRMEQEVAKKREEIEKAHLINSFNYQSLIGLHIKGKCIIAVFDSHELSTIDVRYADNQQETLPKGSLYHLLKEYENA